MTDQNKKTLIDFGKVAGFGLAAFIAIISFVGILNGIAGGLDSFYGWVGAINLGVEVVFFVKWYKKWFKKVEEKKEESK